MIATTARWQARLLLLLCVLLPAALAGAQDAVLAHVDDEGNPLCTVRAFVSGGSSLGIGLGFARIEVDNDSDRSQSLLVEMQSPRWQGSDVRSRRSLVVEAGGRARFFLPVPIPPQRGRLYAEVDGDSMETSVNYPRGNGVVGLFISDQPDAAPQGLTVLQALPSVSTQAPQLLPSLAGDLPSDWRMFTAFSAVVVDGRANLGSERQDALRRYAFAGGKVVVAAPERLAAGALRDVATRAPMVEHGLGFVVAIPPLGGDTTAMRRRVEALPELGRGGWPANQDLFANQDIAGLGRAPVTAFVLVILLFAIVVGPVNFFMLRRRKKPLLALVTVPVLGFGTTVVILLYGIFHDGFGVRGVVTSWTVLDQARHEVVSVAARSLFAGLAPSDLAMPADSLLLSGRAGARRDEWPDRWHWDGDQQRLDGGVLPSRTVTPLLSVQQGTARQRLTVRRIDDDTLEVLGDGGVEAIGTVVLHDFDGQFWSGGGGRLKRIAAARGRKAFAGFARRAAILHVNERGIIGDARVPSLAPKTLAAPGTYVTLVSTAPWLDEHDVKVDYDLQAHFVFGRMHAQDFVR